MRLNLTTPSSFIVHDETWTVQRTLTLTMSSLRSRPPDQGHKWI
jgi:hypothetical protein